MTVLKLFSSAAITDYCAKCPVMQIHCIMLPVSDKFLLHQESSSQAGCECWILYLHAGLHQPGLPTTLGAPGAQHQAIQPLPVV